MLRWVSGADTDAMPMCSRVSRTTFAGTAPWQHSTIYEAFHGGNGGFWYLADALCGGAVFPELILVGQRKGGPLVILEGHVRATAYLLRPECLPAALPVLIGYAPRMEK